MPTAPVRLPSLAIGTIFAALDALELLGEDPRNARHQGAMVLASIMEFAGAVGVGARVADTIRTKIVDTSLFAEVPELLMLGNGLRRRRLVHLPNLRHKNRHACVDHPFYSRWCHRHGCCVRRCPPVSQWVSPEGNINSGVVQVFLAWIIAPGLSGASRPSSSWSPSTPSWLPGTIVGVGAAFALLIGVTLTPWMYRVVIKEDWQLRWYHIPMGLLLLRRGEVPPPPADVDVGVKDYYEGRLTKEQLDARNAAERGDVEVVGDSNPEKTKNADGSDAGSTERPTPSPLANITKAPKSLVGPKPEGKWYQGNVLFWYFKWALLRGIDQDVVNAQSTHNKLASNLDEVHAHAQHFDNKTEYMYSFLQIMTAATASFVHGANDIANAIGPYAKLPVSTTQCITGATVGVGLCSGTWRTVNWRMVAWIYLGWIITLPVTGIISGCLMGIIINAPRWGMPTTN
ncbi:hypothetical protein CHGG_10083 [Chaetomium globosum CBS 148.51]|uniref:Phosphate transporter n=1 Tax=Chaetomium globosum (strain ATCC 6205 / CBS 148.51 / DSM 1962 / NBRC 6347 / NRRL 1970) TaxID=306901 RepID=Q2GPM1_CHAGB|nr:uncharacterized protein CHGG_10083 [Chaetomium globosum CBS 148.51]EAQ83679.1 hypothetical protein CHGG_10083 [Chaetomium globosum CBS 148.51]